MFLCQIVDSTASTKSSILPLAYAPWSFQNVSYPRFWVHLDGRGCMSVSVSYINHNYPTKTQVELLCAARGHDYNGRCLAIPFIWSDQTVFLKVIWKKELNIPWTSNGWNLTISLFAKGKIIFRTSISIFQFQALSFNTWNDLDSILDFISMGPGPSHWKNVYAITTGRAHGDKQTRPESC